MNGNPPQSVFVGVSGASGAPYAARLVRALVAAGCRLQLSVSDSGVLVLQHELELAAAGREAVTAAFLERAGATAEVFAPDDLGALPASGSSAPDAVVICPCSMSTAANIALGTSRTLMHRAADVALKERRPLVVVPRETPLTQIHLRRLLELAEAGAVVLPAMPGFYSRPQTLAGRRRPRGRQGDERARVRPGPLPAVGRGPGLMPQGGPRGGSGDLPIDRDPSRIEAMFGGIAARYDLMNRLMTVGLDGRWRRMAAAEARLTAGEQALDACCGTGDLSFSLAEACPGCDVTGLDFTPAMLVRAREKAAGASGVGFPCRASSSPATCSSCRSRTVASPPSPSGGACATCRTSRAPSARWPA